MCGPAPYLAEVLLRVDYPQQSVRGHARHVRTRPVPCRSIAASRLSPAKRSRTRATCADPPRTLPKYCCESIIPSKAFADTRDMCGPAPYLAEVLLRVDYPQQSVR